jgi:hypothetical protein
MVAMAILPAILGMPVAAPFVALAVLTTESSLMLRFRQSLSLRQVIPMVAASLVGIPLGIWGLGKLDERLVMTLLGTVIIGYAIYALFNFKLPELSQPVWAYVSGFLAGVLGGAFNTSGPPAVIYASCRRWDPAQFKSNLQGFFITNSLIVVAGRILSGNMTLQVWKLYLWALPAIALALLGGALLDRYIRPEVFRKIVLVLLVLMGLRMVLTA